MESEFRAEIVLRCGLGGGAVERCPGARFLDMVIVADDLSRRAHANAEFFFLLRLEETHVPEPDIQLAGHEFVGLL